MKNSERKDAHMDTRYSWVVCFSAMGLFFIMFGSLRSSGVIFVALNQSFGTTRSESSIITVATFGSMFATCVIGGPLVHRYRFRKPLIIGSILTFLGVFSSYFVRNEAYLILTLGVLQGIGLGLIAVPTIAIDSQYFKRHLGVATGISMSGSSLGSIALPPLIEYFVEQFGIRGAFLMCSGVTLHLLVFSFLILDPKSQPQETEKPSNDQKAFDNDAFDFTNENNPQDVSDLQKDDGFVAESSNEDSKIKSHHENKFLDTMRIILKNKFTYGISLLNMCNQISVTAFSITVPDFAVLQGTTLLEASYLISLSSLFDVIARVFLGFIVDKPFVNLIFSYASFVLGAGLVFCFLGLFGGQSYGVLATFCAMYGFFYGGNVLHFPVNTTKYLGSENAHLVISLSFIMASLATFSIAPISSSLFNYFNDYKEFYYITGSVHIAVAIYWFVLGFQERKQIAK